MSEAQNHDNANRLLNGAAEANAHLAAIRSTPHNGKMYQRDDSDYMLALATLAGGGLGAISLQWFRDQARLISGTLDEIEQLEAEIEKLRADISRQNQDWCDDDESIKQQALRVLDPKVVEGDTHYIPRMGALAELMADECLRLKAENARLRKANHTLRGLVDTVTDADEFNGHDVGERDRGLRLPKAWMIVARKAVGDE